MKVVLTFTNALKQIIVVKISFFVMNGMNLV